MKKKLFLITIIVVILTCLFIFSVNAESVKVESSSIDMVISFYDANYNEIKKTVKVDDIFNVDFKNEDGEYYFKLTSVKKYTFIPLIIPPPAKSQAFCVKKLLFKAFCK